MLDGLKEEWSLSNCLGYISIAGWFRKFVATWTLTWTDETRSRDEARTTQK